MGDAGVVGRPLLDQRLGRASGKKNIQSAVEPQFVRSSLRARTGLERTPGSASHRLAEQDPSALALGVAELEVLIPTRRGGLATTEDRKERWGWGWEIVVADLGPFPLGAPGSSLVRPVAWIST